MIPNNFKNLIEKLLNKTQKREVIWQKSSREDEYKLDLDSGALTVDKWSPENKFNMSIDIAIYNDRGDRIDRIEVHSEENPDDFKLLDEFHSEVRRTYYKVDETFKGILTELDKEGAIGKEEKTSDDLPF